MSTYKVAVDVIQCLREVNLSISIHASARYSVQQYNKTYMHSFAAVTIIFM